MIFIPPQILHSLHEKMNGIAQNYLASETSLQEKKKNRAKYLSYMARRAASDDPQTRRETLKKARQAFWGGLAESVTETLLIGTYTAAALFFPIMACVGGMANLFPVLGAQATSMGSDALMGVGLLALGGTSGTLMTMLCGYFIKNIIEGYGDVREAAKVLRTVKTKIKQMCAPKPQPTSCALPARALPSIALSTLDGTGPALDISTSPQETTKNQDPSLASATQNKEASARVSASPPTRSRFSLFKIFYG